MLSQTSVATRLEAPNHPDAAHQQIAECDRKLADPAEYEKLAAEKGYFEKYEQLKKQLEGEMEKWEELSSKLV